MSDTDTQDTTTVVTDTPVVPVDDQPNEDAPVVVPTPPVPDNSQVSAEAAVAATDAAPAADPATPKERAAASDLEGDLRKVLDDYVSGVLKLPEGALPTPHTLAAQIAARRADGKNVSSGAVSAALARWQEIGFATLGSKPTTFIDYTDAARSQGLSALKATNRSAKSIARKAVQEPKAPAVAATPPPDDLVNHVTVPAPEVTLAPPVEAPVETPIEALSVPDATPAETSDAPSGDVVPF